MNRQIRRHNTFVEFNGRHALKDVANDRILTDAIYVPFWRYWLGPSMDLSHFYGSEFDCSVLGRTIRF